MRSYTKFYKVDKFGKVIKGLGEPAAVYKVTIRRGLFSSKALLHFCKIDPKTKEMSITETLWLDGFEAESMGTKSTADPTEGLEFIKHVMYWLKKEGVTSVSGWSPRRVADYLCSKIKNCKQVETKWNPDINVELVKVQCTIGVDMSVKQIRASIGMALVFGIAVIGHNLGLGDLALAGWFIGNGLVGLGALIAYGLGTYSYNVANGTNK